MNTPTRAKAITFRLGDEDLMAAMTRLQERDGISPSEMIRRALRAWLTTKGVLTAPSRKPAKGRA